MVKTLPCPLPTGPCGCEGPELCIGAFPLDTDPLPPDISMGTAPVKLRVLNTGQLYMGNPSLVVPAVHNHNNPPVPIYKVPHESFHTSYMLLEAVVLAAY